MVDVNFSRQLTEKDSPLIVVYKLRAESLFLYSGYHA